MTVLYALEPDLTSAEFVDVLERSTLAERRPIHDAARIAAMLLTLGYVLVAQQWRFLALLPVFGYSFAWVAHFAVERNRPATFQYPLYSLAGDFRMFADMLRGRVAF